MPGWFPYDPSIGVNWLNHYTVDGQPYTPIQQPNGAQPREPNFIGDAWDWLTGGQTQTQANQTGSTNQQGGQNQTASPSADNFGLIVVVGVFLWVMMK